MVCSIQLCLRMRERASYRERGRDGMGRCIGRERREREAESSVRKERRSVVVVGVSESSSELKEEGGEKDKSVIKRWRKEGDGKRGEREKRGLTN